MAHRPRPFEISSEFREELDKLGYRLVLFLKACDQLYRQSAKGRQPAWVADLLDAGKPQISSPSSATTG